MKLIKTRGGNYRVEKGLRVTIEGDLELVEQYLLNCEDVEASELEFALDEMQSKGHDTAIFGVNRTFTHTENTHCIKYAQIELQAIVALRREFYAAALIDEDSQETKAIWNRLMNLYFSFNAKAALQALGFDDEMAA